MITWWRKYRRTRASWVRAAILLELSLAQTANGRMTGYELSKRTDLRPARVYRALDELMAAGRVVDSWGPDGRRFYEYVRQG